jgi:hypothetical protein
VGLEPLADRRKVTGALFVRDVLCDRIDSVVLASLLRFKGNSYSRRRNARLITFFHRTNYGKFEPFTEKKV